MGVTRRLRRGLRRLVVFGCAVLAVTVAAVVWFSSRNLEAHGEGRGLAAPVDALIVLGGGVDGDGVPAYSTRRRVAAAVELLEAGRAKALILTGGLDPRWPGAPAALLMRDHALSLGAPEAALIMEDRSRSTFENLRFAFAIARERGFERLAIVTDAFHLERARRLAAWLGWPGIGLVAVDGLRLDSLGNRVWSTLREALAWWFNLGKVAAWEAMRVLGIDEETRAAWVR